MNLKQKILGSFNLVETSTVSNLQQKIKDLEGELTVYSSGSLNGVAGTLGNKYSAYNPDTITYSIYKRMRKDGLIGMGLQFKKLPIKTRDFTIKCDDTDIQTAVDTEMKRIYKDLVNKMLNGFDFGYCMPYDTRIETDKGKLMIGDIVNKRIELKVKTLNEKTGEIEYRKIVNWFSRKYSNDMVYIYFGRKAPKSIIRCTKEHPILTSNGWKKAMDITTSDNVMVESLALTKEQKSFLYGSLLGDSSLRIKKSNGWKVGWGVTHCEKQKYYLDWIKSLMVGLNPKQYEKIQSSPHYPDRKYKYFTLQTNELASLIEIKNVVLKDNKKLVTKKWLNNVDELGLACWFMDDGTCQYSYNKNKKYPQPLPAFCTDGFSKQECEIIVKWFKDKWNIEAKIMHGSASTKDSTLFRKEIKNKEYYRVYIRKIGEAKKFFSLISKYVQADKNGKKWIAQPILTKEIKNICPVPVVEVLLYDIYKNKQCNYMTVFDIEVEENHNFFVNSAVVHNSPLEKVIFYNNGLWCYKKFKDPDVESITINTDVNGNFNGFTQNYPGTSQLDAEKCLVFVNRFENGNYYGIPETNPAYPFWWSYENIFLYGNRYMERKVDPVKIGHCAKDTQKNLDAGLHPNQTNMLAAMESLKNGSNIVLPNDIDPTSGKYLIDINYLQDDKRTGEFVDYFKYLDAMKLRSILVPEGAVIKDGTGSYSQTESFADMFMLSLEGIVSDLEDCINKYVISPFIDWNFGPDAPRATIDIASLTRDNKALLKEIYIALINKPIMPGEASIVAPNIAKIENTLGIPRIEEENKGQPPLNNQESSKHQHNCSIRLQSVSGALWRMPNNFEQKIALTDIDKLINTKEIEMNKGFNEVLGWMKESAIKYLSNPPGIIETNDINGVKKFALKYINDYTNVFVTYEKEMWLAGKDSIVEEFKVKKVIDNTIPQKELQYITTRAEALSYQYTSALESKIKFICITDINGDKPTKSTLFDISDAFDKHMESLAVPIHQELVSSLNRGRKYAAGLLSKI